MGWYFLPRNWSFWELRKLVVLLRNNNNVGSTGAIWNDSENTGGYAGPNAAVGSNDAGNYVGSAPLTDNANNNNDAGSIGVLLGDPGTEAAFAAEPGSAGSKVEKPYKHLQRPVW